MVKIVYVVPRLNNAGPINQVYNLISNLDREKFDIYIFTMYQELKESRKTEFEKLGIPIECIGLKHKYIKFTAIYKTSKLIKKIQPAIVHSETLPSDILVSRIQRNFKWCTTVHCNIYNDYLLRFPKGLANVMIYRHGRCFKKVDKLICCSITLQQIYNQKGFNSIAIQNGVDTFKFYFDFYHDCNYWKNKLGISCNKKIILVVGSIDYRKRSLFIVKSLKNHLKENNAKLIFCGEGEDLEACKMEACGYDIEFKGKISDIVPYLNASDLYLSASSSEGLPMSVIEAGCCGLPMVLSDIEPHKELMNKAIKVKGIKYVETDNKEEIINAVKEVLNMNVNKKTIAEYFYSNFSAFFMAKQYQQTYLNE